MSSHRKRSAAEDYSPRRHRRHCSPIAAVSLHRHSPDDYSPRRRRRDLSLSAPAAHRHQSPDDYSPRRRHRIRSPSAAVSHRDHSPAAAAARRPKFPSHLESPDLSPRLRYICDILATTPLSNLDTALESSAVRVSSADVEEILKLSYSFPDAAVKFFHWAGSGGADAAAQSPYAWNLIIDLLGKNLRFESAWEFIRTMHCKSIVSLATFASLFSSLIAAGRAEEALQAFAAMESYGVPKNAAALNSLLSAACREGRTALARGLLARAGVYVAPDADSFAILLEGCENEGDCIFARKVFAEMVDRVGWDPQNVPAYDSFLITLVRAGDILEALRHVEVMQARQCFPGLRFFRAALEKLVEKRDARGALSLWNSLVGRQGCLPDTKMFNSMIQLQCHVEQAELAMWLLEEMVKYGAFPDSQTYNLLLHHLLKSAKLKEASAVFSEMVKNDFMPSLDNCSLAIRVFLKEEDCHMAIRVWKCMVLSKFSPLEDDANRLVLELRELRKLPEACKLAEDIIERGIKLHSSTLSKLRTDLLKVGKGSIYDHLLRKWKSH